MANLRNLNTGRELLQQVLLQTGSQNKNITKQPDVQKQQNNKPNLPSKFSAQP